MPKMPLLSNHLRGLDIRDASGHPIGHIANQPGQSGSLAIYHALARLYDGQLTPEAAQLDLEWYAEHTADAIAHPGKHPHIDRLLACASTPRGYTLHPLCA